MFQQNPILYVAHVHCYSRHTMHTLQIDPALAVGVVALIVAIVGYSSRDVISGYRNYRSRRRLEISLDRRKELVARDGQESLIWKTLLTFYSPANLATGNLKAYSFRINNELRTVPYATRDTWLGLSIDVKDVECEFIDAPVWSPSTTRGLVPRQWMTRLEDALDNSGARLWESPLYRLQQIDFDTQSARATFSVDGFSNYRRNSGLMIEEVGEALIEVDFSPARAVARSAALFPLRTALAPDGRSIQEFSTRMTQGGAAVMLALAQRGGGYAIPIMRRSREVAGAQGQRSVAFAGFHSPLNDVRTDVNIGDSILREFWEELLGGAEGERYGQRVSGRWYFPSVPALQWLVDHPAALTIEVVCFGSSLINASFEFGCLMAVHDPGFWEAFGDEMRANWESHFETLVISNDPDSLARLLRYEDWVPEGLCTFVEGLLRLQRLAPSGSVALPPLARS